MNKKQLANEQHPNQINIQAPTGTSAVCLKHKSHSYSRTVAVFGLAFDRLFNSIAGACSDLLGFFAGVSVSSSEIGLASSLSEPSSSAPVDSNIASSSSSSKSSSSSEGVPTL
ncbi:hypothetical protein T02_11199 [Trichinella nativa]|uniref:Uncharacterized protein n=2 Tax=Trichinella TaxID=6333 RepID=A0A0V1LAL3_9BILA|nr:hypothetical protein T05_6560 [Trichinella murrelli]KRX81116.1 hypothetical protein T06_1606 [Trichinella sp. T6]KRZ56258.1 hypothetical protein T02_11199 [Trichinella nativa]